MLLNKLSKEKLKEAMEKHTFDKYNAELEFTVDDLIKCDRCYFHNNLGYYYIVYKNGEFRPVNSVDYWLLVSGKMVVDSLEMNPYIIL